jgi:hypothetical protein
MICLSRHTTAKGMEVFSEDRIKNIKQMDSRICEIIIQNLHTLVVLTSVALTSLVWGVNNFLVSLTFVQCDHNVQEQGGRTT